MERLWISIMLLCWRYGEIEGFNPIAECLGIDQSLARVMLERLEDRDERLRVVRFGRGRRMRITYEFEGLPRHISIRWQRDRILTLDTNIRYLGSYDGRTN